MSTKERLLVAAIPILAEKGYHQTTIAAICGEAEANIAAVNYHFGSKEGLYAEAWRRALRSSLERHPPDGGVSADAPPEERLRARLTAALRRAIDPESMEFAIMMHEMANSTGLLQDALKEDVGPLLGSMCAVVREIAGPAPTDMQINMCVESLMAQLIHNTRRVRNNPVPVKLEAPTDVESIAEHIVTFTLAGIRAIAATAGGTSK